MKDAWVSKEAVCVLFKIACVLLDIARILLEFACILLEIASFLLEIACVSMEFTDLLLKFWIYRSSVKGSLQIIIIKYIWLIF